MRARAGSQEREKRALRRIFVGQPAALTPRRQEIAADLCTFVPWRLGVEKVFLTHKLARHAEK
jgi:hypothetical protein